MGVLDFFFLIAELVYKKKRAWSWKFWLFPQEEEEEEENQHFGVWPRARKENWSLGICVALYLFFFQVLSMVDLIFSVDSKSL